MQIYKEKGETIIKRGKNIKLTMKSDSKKLTT